VNANVATTAGVEGDEAQCAERAEKIVEIERRLFAELRTGQFRWAEAKRIRQTSLAIAEVDVLAGDGAHRRSNRDYVRPAFSDDKNGEMEIIGCTGNPVSECHEFSAEQ